MNCYLCGRDEGRHHLGCALIESPGLTEDEAIEKGLLPPKAAPEPRGRERAEILKPGSMTTVPEDDGGEPPAKGGETVEGCEFAGCDNPKYSTSPRAKYCAEHKDPKNRKE